MLRASGGEPTLKKHHQLACCVYNFNSIKKLLIIKEKEVEIMGHMLSIDVSHLVLYFRLLNNFKNFIWR